MTLLLTETDVRSLLTMPIALEIVEESLRQQGNGNLVLHPRRRVKLPDNALLHYMAAADPVRGYIGMKLYTAVRGVARFVVTLFRSTTGEMAALIEADALGQLRTGAASGVATKYLANADARTACIIGTGYQARTQLEAVAAVRRLKRHDERRSAGMVTAAWMPSIAAAPFFQERFEQHRLGRKQELEVGKQPDRFFEQLLAVEFEIRTILVVAFAHRTIPLALRAVLAK